MSLFEDQANLQRSDKTASELVASEMKSRAPLRASLQKRSGFEFADRIAATLVSDGIDVELAASATADLVATPHLAVSHRLSGAEETQIVQAVTIKHGTVGTAVLMLRAQIVPGQALAPPEVANVAAEVFLLSTDDRGVITAAEIENVCERLEQIQQELGLRRIDRRPTDAPQSWTVVGNPSHRLSDTPSNWKTRVESLGTVLAMKSNFAASPADLASKSKQLAEVVVVLEDGNDWEPLKEQRVGADLPTISIELRGGFDQMITDVRREIVGYVRLAIDPPAPQKRELRLGEIVYHRKIQPQPRKYDRFDAGSATGCSHEGIDPWRNADKAVKGMHRIYSNFEPSMLYHCSRYPNCNVYVVKA